MLLGPLLIPGVADGGLPAVVVTGDREHPDLPAPTIGEGAKRGIVSVMDDAFVLEQLQWPYAIAVDDGTLVGPESPPEWYPPDLAEPIQAGHLRRHPEPPAMRLRVAHVGDEILPGELHRGVGRFVDVVAAEPLAATEADQPGLGEIVEVFEDPLVPAVFFDQQIIMQAGDDAVGGSDL